MLSPVIPLCQQKMAEVAAAAAFDANELRRFMTKQFRRLVLARATVPYFFIGSPRCNPAKIKPGLEATYTIEVKSPLKEPAPYMIISHGELSDALRSCNPSRLNRQFGHLRAIRNLSQRLTHAAKAATDVHVMIRAQLAGVGKPAEEIETLIKEKFDPRDGLVVALMPPTLDAVIAAFGPCLTTADIRAARDDGPFVLDQMAYFDEDKMKEVAAGTEFEPDIGFGYPSVRVRVHLPQTRGVRGIYKTDTPRIVTEEEEGGGATWPLTHVSANT